MRCPLLALSVERFRAVRRSKSEQLMSALGQKQTSRPEISMSALRPKADIGERNWMSALCQKRTLVISL
jgi:hypothetical protein